MLRLFALMAGCLGLGYVPLGRFAALQVRIPGPGGAGAGASVACIPATGYSYCRQLMVSGSQVGGSTLTSFGVLVNTTLGASRIQSSNCYDVIFTSDSGGTTKIPWEVEECTQSSGAIVAWAGLSSLPASSNTNFYVSYDNSSITTAQNTGSAQACNVWDASYARVFHLGNGSAMSVNDSTCNAGNLANSGLTAGSGQIDGGAVGNGSSYASGADTGLPSGSTARTIEIWFDISSFSASHSLLQFGTPSVSHEMQEIAVTSGSIDWYGWSDDFGASHSFSPGVWYYFAGTYNGTSTATIYINNSTLGTHTQSWNTTLNGTLYVGKDTYGGSSALLGAEDEVRISKVQRSTGYLTAQWNQMQTGSTFLTVGSEY